MARQIESIEILPRQSGRLIPPLGTRSDLVISDDWRHVFTDGFTRYTPRPILPYCVSYFLFPVGWDFS
jgi:hypothetical protein